MAALVYGFLDESGILSLKAGSGKYFVIIVLIVGKPEEIQRVMRHARKRADHLRKTHRVFKASKEQEGFVRLVLRELTKHNVEIVVGVWEKKSAHVGNDEHALYARLVAQTVSAALCMYPRLSLVVHRRYPLPRLRDRMDAIVSSAVQDGQFLSLSHRSEIECRALEIADAVAWAVFQKYNRQDASYYQIIEEKIKKEKRLAA